MDRTTEIAEAVLVELDNFDANFVLHKRVSPLGGIGSRESYAVSEAQKLVADEPIIVYAKVAELVDGKWLDRIYLINRYATPRSLSPADENAMFCTRNSPVGRVASLDVGEEMRLRIGKKVRHLELVEKSIFRPRRGTPWDAVNSVVYHSGEREDVGSFREWVSNYGEYSDVLGDEGVPGLSLDRDARARVSELRKQRARRRRRQARAIESVALRDQLTLDSKQDNFCRLPLDAQAILLGAPGTGKTTTLIKRLAIALDPQSRPEDEELTESQERVYYRPSKNWYLFTPSKLLRSYVDEALKKEALAHSDEYVRLWSAERARLATSVLEIVRRHETGLFSLARRRTLVGCKGPYLIDLAVRFCDYLTASYRTTLGPATEAIAAVNVAAKEVPASDLTKQVASLVAATRRAAQPLVSESMDGSVRELIATVRSIADLRVKARDLTRRADYILNSIIDEIASRGGLSDTRTSIALDEGVRKAIRRAALSAARRLVQGKRDRRTEDTDPVEAAVRNALRRDATVGTRLKLVSLVREAEKHFALLPTGIESVLSSIPEQYRLFREQTASTDPAYANVPIESLVRTPQIGDDELDLLVYVMLSVAKQIFRENPHWLETPSGIDLLDEVKDLYRAHVVVDEATDFSVVQLGCMSLLAHPLGGSVVFAGDLMQRMTLEGLEAWEHCERLSPRFEQYKLEKLYRQSPGLHAVALRLYEVITKRRLGKKVTASDDDPRPLRFTGHDRVEAARWIACRVDEIRKIHQGRPVSIAVFVSDEDGINEAFELLNEPLANLAIQVEPCHQGRVRTDEPNVRIFSVDFIKGLEFEAVFLMDIDRLGERDPDLVDKYLYVGLTRAANFLAVTSTIGFPEKLRQLEPEFEEGTWAEYLSR